MAREMEQAPAVPFFQLRAVFIAGLAACSASAETQPTFSAPPSTEGADATVSIGEKSRPYITTTTIAMEAATPVVSAPAKVAFRDGALSQINLPVPGRVTAVHVATGDHVKAGDPLLTLSSPEAAAARAAATAALVENEVARRELSRQEQMATSGVGIESEKGAAQAKVHQSEAELARAQTTAAMLGGGGGSTIVLRAPIDGTVISRRATVGTVAEPGGEPLIELGNANALLVVADVFDRDLAQVKVGAEVDVELAAGAELVHGKVASIGAAVTSSLRTVPVYIALDGTSTSLRAGMFARATIKAPPGQSIVLPAESVLVKNGEKYIVYIKSGERYAPRDVTVGRSVAGRVQILTGLRVGDQVVTKGALLIDGEAEQLL